MTFRFRVLNQQKRVSFPVPVEAENDLKAHQEIEKLYPKSEGWEIKFLPDEN